MNEIADPVDEQDPQISDIEITEERSSPNLTRKPGRQPLRLRTLSPLRYRDYRYLWTGVLLMSAGQWVQQLTLGWLLYDISGSSLLLGAINGMRSIPFLVSGPIAGVAADRVDRRSLLMGTQILLMVSALVMWPVVTSGKVEAWHLFLFTLVSGIAWSINQPVRHSLVPSVVPKEELSGGVALASMGANINKIIGPTIGGLLIAWFGAGGNFLVQGAAYAGVLVMIYLMNAPEGEMSSNRKSAWVELKEGSAYVLVNPEVRILLASTFIIHTIAMPAYQTLMPIFQKDVLGVGPGGLGLLLAAPGAGAIVATFFVPRFTDTVESHNRAMVFGLVMMGISLVLFSQSTSLIISLLILACVGFAQMLVLAINMTMLQISVPDTLRGRVMSIYMLDRGLTPIGALLAGVGAFYIGADGAVAIMGVFVVILAVVLAFHSTRLSHASQTVS